MYTNYTYQDWENGNGTQLLLKIVRDYMCSTEFSQGLSAMRYFRGENDAIAAKTIVKAKTINTLEGGKKRRHLVHEDVAGNRVGNNFFFKAVTQQSQYLLANGVRLDDGIKEKLGLGFDAALLECSERALMCGVCWGFYNFDHVEVIPAVQDADSGFVALLDEMSSLPRVGIQFWRSRHDKPMYVRLFE